MHFSFILIGFKPVCTSSVYWPDPAWTNSVFECISPSFSLVASLFPLLLNIGQIHSEPIPFFKMHFNLHSHWFSSLDAFLLLSDWPDAVLRQAHWLNGPNLNGRAEFPLIWLGGHSFLLQIVFPACGSGGGRGGTTREQSEGQRKRPARTFRWSKD